MATCAVTGTVGDGATEAEIVSGTGTVILTLTGDTWVAAGLSYLYVDRSDAIAMNDGRGAELDFLYMAKSDAIAVTGTGLAERQAATGGTVTRLGQGEIAVTGNISQAITVPTGTDLLVVGVSGAWATATIGDSCAIGGNACTQQVLTEEATYASSAIWTRVSPPTGSQTLAVTFDSGPLVTSTLYWAAYDVVDTSTPVRDTGSHVVTSGGACTTGAMDSATGDAVFAIGTGEVALNIVWTGATEVDENSGDVIMGWAEGFASGATHTTSLTTGGSYAGLSSIVIKVTP